MSQLATPFDSQIELIGEVVEVLRLRRRLYRYCARTHMGLLSAERIARGLEPVAGTELTHIQELKIEGILEHIRVIERGPE